MENELHLEFLDLAGLAITIDEFTFIPIKLDSYFDTNSCEVTIIVYKNKLKKTVTRRGKIEDGVFKTAINNVKLIINVKTGVIKKNRK